LELNTHMGIRLVWYFECCSLLRVNQIRFSHAYGEDGMKFICSELSQGTALLQQRRLPQI
jgi:hypothetical protein